MRVVFDTNIYISAFAIPGGDAEQAYLHAVRGRFQLFTSVAILTETANVLETKFEWPHRQVQRLLRAVNQTAAVLKTKPNIHVLKDDPDNRILECAIQAKADLIVTGDRHLLELNSFEEVAIVRLRDFLERFELSSPD